MAFFVFISMKKIIILIVLIFNLNLISYSQDVIMTKQKHEQLRKNIEDYKKLIVDYDKLKKDYTLQSKRIVDLETQLKNCKPKRKPFLIKIKEMFMKLNKRKFKQKA